MLIRYTLYRIELELSIRLEREYFRLGAESYSSFERVGKKKKKKACPLLDVFDCGQVSNPRLYRLKIMLEKLRPKNKC